MSADEADPRDERASHRTEKSPGLPAVRLESMSEADFDASRDRAIPRHAADQVRRGLWTEEESLEASRVEFAQLLPQGSATPHFHFCNVVDESTKSVLGETWYSVRAMGGKVQFWIDWIWIEPRYRRRGYATQVFRYFEKEAAKLGADRIGLHVVVENDGAIALYSQLGYQTTNLRMTKLLNPAP